MSGQNSVWFSSLSLPKPHKYHLPSFQKKALLYLADFSKIGKLNEIER